MLPPREVGRILQALQTQAHEHVLEVGTGSGYLTTLFAMQAAQVLSVELFADIAAQAKKNCQKQTLKNITLQVGDAALGWETHTNFDIICITAALPYIADHWKQQLKIGGRLFVVVGQGPVMQATLVTRLSAQEWEQHIIYQTLLPLLVHTEPTPQFEF